MIEFEVEEKNSFGARIKVMGVGGGGGNAVNSMIDSDLQDVNFLVTNTDAQALDVSPVDIKIQIGEKVTKGLGAGSNPDIGRRAAEEDLELITENIADADILFLTAGMGGGTGTGATPVIAKAARELGVLTVAVVTKPFIVEGRKRLKQAEEAIALLRKEVDTLIVIPNQKLLDLVDPNISMLDAFSVVNNVLKQAIKGVADIIMKPGHINVDFADVRAIMSGMGMALMGTGRAKGEDRAKQAAMTAINSPLLENISIEGAKGVLINITGDSSLGLQEINDAAKVIYEKSSDDAEIILGSVIDPGIGDEVMITVIATGFDKQEEDLLMAMPRASVSRVREAARSNAQKKIIDIPASKDKEVSATEKLPSNFLDLDANDLDTPTFLRRQTSEEKEDEGT
ncbi:cell division protein FtsZ [Candidatus Babeliales bacterium]|nr:cell division protein FtsZ [Candidatus Babeliales bacterium]